MAIGVKTVCHNVARQSTRRHLQLGIPGPHAMRTRLQVVLMGTREGDGRAQQSWDERPAPGSVSFAMSVIFPCGLSLLVRSSHLSLCRPSSHWRVVPMLRPHNMRCKPQVCPPSPPTAHGHTHRTPPPTYTQLQRYQGLASIPPALTTCLRMLISFPSLSGPCSGALNGKLCMGMCCGCALTPSRRFWRAIRRRGRCGKLAKEWKAEEKGGEYHCLDPSGDCLFGPLANPGRPTHPPAHPPIHIRLLSG